MQGVHGDQRECAQGMGKDHHIPTFPRLGLSDDFPGKEMRIGWKLEYGVEEGAEDEGWGMFHDPMFAALIPATDL